MAYPHPYIALDLNQLRDARALESALANCRTMGLELLVPDGAFFEMSQSKKPFETWRRSLEQLAPFRELVVVSDKLSHLMRAELRSGFPSQTLANPQATQFLRELLAEISSSDFTTLSRIINGPVSAGSVGATAWSQHELQKQMLVGLCTQLQPELTGDVIKKLRQHPETAASDWLLSKRGLQFTFQGIRHQAGDDQVSAMLMFSPSVLASFHSALVGLAIDWCAFGGLPEAAPKALTNDLHDLEFVVIGSLCHTFASKDRRASRLGSACKLGHTKRRTLVAELMVAEP